MDIDHAIKSRRTVKAFAPEPVESEVLDELFELARWAPNHGLTNPWRFRVIGPKARDRIKRVASDQARDEAPAGADPDTVAAAAAAKLDRAPTLVLCSTVVDDDPVKAMEDRCATACAAYIVLLGAHARGLSGYWRTPALLRTAAGRAAAALPAGEELIGLLYLGHGGGGETAPPEREPRANFVTYLD